MIHRSVKGERGYEIITPLYTGIDKETGNLLGVMVNRGRIPYEYKDSQMHYAGCENGQETEVEGVIFYSEGAGSEKEDNKTGVVSSIKEHKK